MSETHRQVANNTLIKKMMQSPLCKSGSTLDLSTLAEEDKEALPVGKLRRVFTTHARRRSQRRAKKDDPGGQAAVVPGFNLSRMMKEPLRVVHSVPLSFPNGSSSARSHRSLGVELKVSFVDGELWIFRDPPSLPSNVSRVVRSYCFVTEKNLSSSFAKISLNTASDCGNIYAVLCCDDSPDA
ncbi:hypothetical protein FOCC_FOCC004146 [Frankliniella occidentalis]|nr:hypothetical protein FOCC_FOCC004146 [Frankliniella occidentalis]